MSLDAAPVDPAATATGRDLLEGIRAGIFPPPAAAALVGLDLEEVGDGATVFGFQPDPRFDNGMGAVNGGVLAVVADFAVSTAAMTLLPMDLPVATTTLNLSYLRPVPSTGGRLRAEGRVLHLGGRVAHAEAVVLDGRGRHCVHATATLHIPR
jgi:uncharacterized protein (TIGR00369 family)